MNADNNSGQKGFAVITDMGDSVTVVVETNEPDVAGSQLIHIHKGNCGEVEGIYADLLSLAPLPDKPGRVGSTSKEVRKRPEGLLQFEEKREGDMLEDELLAPGCLSSVYVSALAPAKKGAWPLGVAGLYDIDDAHLQAYARAARTRQGFQDYLEEFVL